MTSYLAAANSLILTRGESKTLVLSIEDADGNPFDLTAYVLWFSVKKSLADSGCVIRKKSSVLGEAAITDPKAGLAEVYLVPGDTSGLPLATYVFDAWIAGIPPETKRYMVIGPASLELADSVTRIS